MMPTGRARFLFVLLPVILLLAGVTYCVYWWVLATGMRDGIVSWAEARRAEGWVVSYRDLEITGFPLTVRLQLDEPRIVVPDLVDWSGPRLTGTMHPQRPDVLRLSAPGRHGVSLTYLPGLAYAFAVSGESVLAEIELGGGGVRAADIVIEKALFSGPEGSSRADRFRLSTETPRLPRLPDYRTPTFLFSADVLQLDLPPESQSYLGQRLTSGSLRGRLLGPLPKAPARQALEEWRSAGGTIEIEQLLAAGSPLRISANGTVSLDKDLQPMAALSAQVQGFFQLVDALKESGMVRSREASMAKVLLGLMSKNDGRNQNTLTVPVTLQDRLLYAGPVALARLPWIAWDNSQPLSPAPSPGTPESTGEQSIGPRGEVIRKEQSRR